MTAPPPIHESSERRQHPRAAIREYGSMILPGELVECAIEDISRGGARLRVRSRSAVPPQTFVLVRRNTQLQDCRLVWAHGAQIGVAFNTPAR